MSVVIMMILETPVMPGNMTQWLLTAGHSVSYALHLPLFMFGSKCISGNMVNLVHSTTVVFMLVAQYTVLSPILPGDRNWIEVVGVVFVLCATASGSIIEFLSK